MSTFAQLSHLQISELKTRLEQEGVKAEELRGFCKYLGLLQAGSKAVMIVKILEKIAEGDFVPKSPEGRGGRERALRPGAAAAALRGATANDLSSSNHELDDEFADTAMQWTHTLPAPLPLLMRGKSVLRTIRST